MTSAIFCYREINGIVQKKIIKFQYIGKYTNTLDSFMSKFCIWLSRITNNLTRFRYPISGYMAQIKWIFG